MSGQAVIVTAPIAVIAVGAPLLLAGAAIAGTVALGTLAAKGVRAIIEHEVAAARQRAAAERARLAEWHAFAKRQQAAMAEARHRQDAIMQLQHRLLQVRLHAPASSPVRTSPTASQAQGYNSESEQRKRLHDTLSQTLDEITAALAALPAALDEHKGSPFAILREQVRRYAEQIAAGRLPAASAIESLKITVQRTASDFLTRIEGERQARENRIRRADAALDLLLLLEQLAPKAARELDAIRRLLLDRLAADDLPAQDLHDIEGRLSAIAQQAAAAVAQGAVRPALAEALLRNLRDLDYEVLTDFPPELGVAPANAQVRIPGGEQVTITMATDARLSFALQHERSQDDGAELTPAEIAFAKTQEVRWCRDLAKVTSNLVAEGFDSTVTFERKVHAQAIPVVNWERFADQVQEDAAESELRRRHDQARRQEGRIQGRTP